jgi:putative flippase GtrA
MNGGPKDTARLQPPTRRRRSRRLRLSVVVPTRNESDNVELLHAALAEALDGIEHEVIVVDDSNDGATPAALAAIAANDPRWRVIERPPEEQTGLSTAAVMGIGAARGAAVCILDGDLQHPPDVIPALLATVEHSADVAVASRYARGGSELGLAGRLRLWGSRFATALTHLVFPETQSTSDPLSGFFCCRREAVTVLELRPVGFKILVELLVCAPEQTVKDVAYAMRPRLQGDSKADPRQAMLFARHLLSLFVYVPGSARPLKFAIVTAAGVGALVLPLLALLRMGTAPIASWAIAVVVAVTAQIGLHRLFTFRELFFHGAPIGINRFRPSAVVSLVAALSALVLLLAPAEYAPLALAAFVQCIGMFVALALSHPRLPELEPIVPGEARAVSLEQLQKRIGAEHACWATPAGLFDGLPDAWGMITPQLVRQIAARGRPLLLAESPSGRYQPRVNLDRESALLIPVAGRRGRPGPVAILIRRRRNPFSAGELEAAVRWLGGSAEADVPSSTWARVSAVDYLTAAKLATAATVNWGRAKLPSAWRFGAVGAAGLGVNQALLWMLVDGAHIQYLLGAAVASQGSTAFNFAWLEAWVFRGRVRSRGRFLRFIVFDLINSSSLAVRLPVMFALTSGLHIHYLVSNVIALALTTLIRFLISDDLIWARHTATETKRRVASWPQEAGAIFRYDIDGLVAIESEAPLIELAYFATDANGQSSAGAECDLVLQVDQVGGLTPRGEASVSRDGNTILYRQHLGSLIANFQIELARQVRVIASPGLALSPHVLYTNVVEPLLRFMFIHRARVLLHAACVSLNGTGVLVSAKTDTGKTSTILRLLTGTKGAFLSDDMTIIDGHGVASRYPKPLTISAHTLGAVPMNRLSRAQRAALALQSRVHSRRGRNVAHFLGTLNVPIMAINAGVQLAVPPPKYTINELIDCEVAERVSPRFLFLIERGPESVTELTHDEALSELLKNSEDAYGFPPYAELAPLIQLGDQSYTDMLRIERSILAAALESITCVRIRSDSFDWDRQISAYISRPDLVEPAAETA